MGLISLLHDVALSRDMPFHQLQQLHSVQGAIFLFPTLCLVSFPTTALVVMDSV